MTKLGNIITIRRTLMAVLLCVSAMTMLGQTDAQLTQYFEAPTYYNPAAVGSSDRVRIRVGSRLQWLGIDNAPVTFLGVADTKLKLLNKFVGVGVMAQQESAGLYRNLTIGVQLGYKLKLLKGELTIGIQPGFLSETFKGSEVFIPDDDDFHQSTDEAIPTSDMSGTAFDLGAGVWYTHRLFWAGVSMTHLMSPVINFSGETGDTSGAVSQEKKFQFQARRTLYFMAGCNIPIKNTLFEVMPSVLVKSDFSFTGAEITARARYNKFLTAGIGYRYNDAISAVVSAEIKGFFIGYSFDYPLSSLNRASAGSHEIFAGYSLKLDFSEKNKNKHKSIRLM